MSPFKLKIINKYPFLPHVSKAVLNDTLHCIDFTGIPEYLNAMKHNIGLCILFVRTEDTFMNMTSAFMIIQIRHSENGQPFDR